MSRQELIWQRQGRHSWLQESQQTLVGRSVVTTLQFCCPKHLTLADICAQHPSPAGPHSGPHCTPSSTTSSSPSLFFGPLGAPNPHSSIPAGRTLHCQGNWGHPPTHFCSSSRDPSQQQPRQEGGHREGRGSKAGQEPVWGTPGSSWPCHMHI